MSVEPDAEASTWSSPPVYSREPVKPNEERVDSDQMARPTQSTTSGVFSLEYYMKFFDVDTIDVMYRCMSAINPFSKTQFVADEQLASASGRTHVILNPDLYGPFWITTTLILVLFFATTLVGLLFSSWQGVHYEYKFNLLTGAAAMMYAYTYLAPLCLWILLRYLEIAPLVSLLHLICLYGYSNVIWIPVAILSVSPLLGTPMLANIIRWVFIAIGLAMSSFFIGRNVYRFLVPVADSSNLTNRNPGRLILAAVLVVQVALSFGIEMLFGGVKVKQG